MRDAIIGTREQEVGSRAPTSPASHGPGRAERTIRLGHPDRRRAAALEQTDVDWVSSPTSVDEVGVIHTIQGYDLNYAGVIIGTDLRYDRDGDPLRFDRTNYFDPTAANNMPRCWYHLQ